MPNKSCFWTAQEDELLRTNYQLKKKDLLKLFPKRSPPAINIRASQLGLKKERNEYVEGKCDILLEDKSISYYWIGFILADGHISPKFRLRVSLSYIDYNHLEKLAKLLKCKIFRLSKRNKDDFCGLAIQDKYIFSKLINKFNISNSKTYNPPSIDKIPINEDLFLSLFAGFIDGDGSIKYQSGRKDCSIELHIHSSWLNFLLEVHNRINQLFQVDIAPPKIGNDGYTKWSICNRKVINGLKEKFKKLKLPILDRKWSKIDCKLKYHSHLASYKHAK